MVKIALGIFVRLFIVCIVLVCSDASSSKIPMKTSGGVSCFDVNFFGSQFATARYNKKIWDFSPQGITNHLFQYHCVPFFLLIRFLGKKFGSRLRKIYFIVMRKYHKNITHKFIIYTQNDIYRCIKSNYFDLCFSGVKQN